MSLMSAFKSVFAAGAKELSKEYGNSPIFLKGVCASCALVAWADGSLEKSEKDAAISVISNHSELSKLYDRPTIERTLAAALDHGTTATGKQELARDLDAIKAAGGSMADDVYLVAVDVAGADGNVADQEKEVLKKIANRLGVDPSKFEF